MWWSLFAIFATIIVDAFIITTIMSTIVYNIVDDFTSTNEDALQSGVTIKVVGKHPYVFTETSSPKKIDYFIWEEG